MTTEYLELASVATSVRDMFTTAPLRPHGFPPRLWRHLRIDRQLESRNPGWMVVRLPGKNKASKHGHWGGKGVAREPVIEIDSREWCAATKIIGLPLMRSFDAAKSTASQFIHQVDKNRESMSQDRSRGIVREIADNTRHGGGDYEANPLLPYPSYGRIFLG